MRKTLANPVQPLLAKAVDDGQGSDGGNASLGAEVLVNGGFTGGSAGWSVANADATHLATFDGSTCRYQSDTAAPVCIVTNSSGAVMQAGRRYRITVTATAYGGGGIRSDRAGGLIAAANGVTVTDVTCPATGTFNFYRNSALADITIDSISVRPLQAG